MSIASTPAATPSPWHAGETLLQRHAGVAERMQQTGPKVIRDYMPDQHREFFAQLPFLVAGAVDGQGDPWAGVLEGPPGFAVSPDPRVLRVCATPDADDPLLAGLGPDRPVGVLGRKMAPTSDSSTLMPSVYAVPGSAWSTAVPSTIIAAWVMRSGKSAQY